MGGRLGTSRLPRRPDRNQAEAPRLPSPGAGGRRSALPPFSPRRRSGTRRTRAVHPTIALHIETSRSNRVTVHIEPAETNWFVQLMCPT